MSALFITAVGTGVGKTMVTTILAQQARAAGYHVAAIKPVVSGYIADDPESDPALILRSLGVTPDSEAIASIAPWRFAAPLSPHLAAQLEGRWFKLAEVARFCLDRDEGDDSLLLIEGAGGLMSPIANDATCLDLVMGLKLPTLLVTGTYLGSISHTLTALSALRMSGARVRGIVVSESVDSVGMTETIESLRDFGAGDVPIDPLPRLAGDPESRWRSAPTLLHLLEWCR